MAVRLLALDLDGTLIHDMTDIPPRSARAVRAAVERGVRVTLATGREYAATEPYARQLNLNAPLICYQGGLIQDHRNGQAQIGEALPLASARRIIDWAREEGLALIVYTGDGLYAETISPLMAGLLAKVKVSPRRVRDLRAAVQVPPIKCLLVERAESARQRVVQLQAALGNDAVKVFQSYPTIIEAMPSSVSKGRALAKLARQLGIPQANVMAVGDQDNDVEMIAWAGLGVAMRDGSPAARAAADVIAPPVTEEGVAWAIERFILSEEGR
ncbi:MAG: Cof-type HAD-IIB family hydrolase [Anaerolineae bacterium]